ncbi:hypothetical protein AUR64_06375 [Haloprofundus marisrubri]|uniref:Uncharacterized protein n=1 Tax=Haloprofundus marisrubri TaxID=1514971 RepID=A0A0W1RCM6_9EURY|nr:hypothetical protein [Haloprofundus marisrubri]KTG10812.1 hypothetical protein AUR64_06375 [Haloprofundus marisrubri]
MTRSLPLFVALTVLLAGCGGSPVAPLPTSVPSETPAASETPLPTGTDARSATPAVVETEDARTQTTDPTASTTHDVEWWVENDRNDSAIRVVVSFGAHPVEQYRVIHPNGSTSRLAADSPELGRALADAPSVTGVGAASTVRTNLDPTAATFGVGENVPPDANVSLVAFVEENGTWVTTGYTPSRTGCGSDRSLTKSGFRFLDNGTSTFLTCDPR